VLAVGATTEHGCLAEYSHFRKRTDLLAPGGGPAREEAGRDECAADHRPILQLSFECFPLCSERLGRFGIRPDLGTSMAAAHASGVAALVRAVRVIGAQPKPARLARRLICTARTRKPKRFYRPGLLDAAKAVRTSARKC
jgi:serine protease